MTDPEQQELELEQEKESQEARDNVTNILTKLNKRASDKGWRFEQKTDKNWLSLDKINPSEGILVILKMDQPDILSIDCDRFMEGITREMTSKKSLVNSENRIYIKERGRYLQIVYVETREKSRVLPVSNFVNCSEDKIKQSKTECKLPEVIKELIWECIEPKINDPTTNKDWIDELRRFYLPEVELQKLVPEEREPPLCDFFKEIGPKINITTPNVCGDKMIDYLKTHLADMREDINKISKTGKQKETADFEKSVEMELAGNEMWEIIKSAIDQPTETFDPNRFIKANINMPTTQADQDVEHKEQE